MLAAQTLSLSLFLPHSLLPSFSSTLATLVYLPSERRRRSWGEDGAP